MNAEKTGKLKKVLDAVPAGYLVDAQWLLAQGVAYETFRDYVKRGWLERVARGVFRRPGPNESGDAPLDWKVCMLSLQYIMRYEIHVGGISALGQQGYDHYLRLGSTAPVWIYGDIPTWLGRVPVNAAVESRKTSLFDDPSLGLSASYSKANEIPASNWSLIMSSPERAILEAMDELPDKESFHTVDMVFESLTTLRPKMLTGLLHSCRKIKVKRLFFVFADRHGHSWRKRLDAEQFDLGSGDRAMIKGGSIHPRYRIVVPDEFAEGVRDES